MEYGYLIDVFYYIFPVKIMQSKSSSQNCQLFAIGIQSLLIISSLK